MKDFKVDVPKSNKTIMWTTVFEWYVARCGSKSKCLKEIGQCAQNMLTILGSILSMTAKTYMNTKCA